MKKHTKKSILKILLVILPIVGGFIIFDQFIKDEPAKNTTSINPTTDSSSQTFEDSVPINTTPNPDPNVPGNTSTKGDAPIAPSGSFVSAARAGINEQIQSTCNSTVGATCVISFKKDSITKSLDTKTVSYSGKQSQVATAAWQWTPASIGLVSGVWQVQATAELNGQTVSTVSTTVFEITQ